MPTKSRQLTKWSPTRIRTLERCPRKHALRYIIARGAWPNGPRADEEHAAKAWEEMNWTPPDLMLCRLSVDGLKTWLSWCSQDRLFTPGRMELWLRKALREEMDSMPPHWASDSTTEVHQDDDGLLEMLVHEGMRRMLAGRGQEYLAELATSDVEWHLVPRFRAIEHSDALLFAAPDLIRLEQEQVHLIQLCAQARRAEPSPSQKLELGAMLLWARSQEDLAIEPERFVIHRIAWVEDAWEHWSQPGSTRWRDQAATLVSCDLDALAKATSTQKLRSDEELEGIGRAQSKTDCLSCGHAWRCPGPLRSGAQRVDETA